MALYEQLSIPSHRFNGVALPFNSNSNANSVPPSSSTPGTINERATFSPLQQSSSMHPIRMTDNRHSELNNQRVQQEHKRRQEDDNLIPIFDQQSGTSQNHQNRENERITLFGAVAFSGHLSNVQNARQIINKPQKENSQDFTRSASNQLSRPNPKVPLKETNESLHMSLS